MKPARGHLDYLRNMIAMIEKIWTIGVLNFTQVRTS
jgi:hypothetical protein